MAKVALITGVTGQDGAYLVDHLVSLDYEVHGIVRRSSVVNTSRIDHVRHDFHRDDVDLHLHYGDMADSSGIARVISEVRPDEIYNLAAQSDVHVSFDIPEYTADIDGLGTTRILEAIRILRLVDKTKFYQASTSELFGDVKTTPQNENTPFYPRSPYAAAKLYSYWITVNYREAYGIHASNGILFNHESPLRGENFVTRKISRAVAEIAFGRREPLRLGNLDAKRDWGHARDYVKGMWMMLNQPEPDDYVLATGETRSVREFVECAFAQIERRVIWHGSGVDESGVDEATGETLVCVDPAFFRPTEVNLLIGDATKARTKLGWARETSFHDLVGEMVRHDLASRAHASSGSSADGQGERPSQFIRPPSFR